MAIIRVKRLSRPVGALYKFDVFINNVCVGKLRDDEQASYVVPEGSHTVFVKEAASSNTLVLNLKNHECVNLVVSSENSENSQQLGIFAAFLISIITPYLPQEMQIIIISILIIGIILILCLWRLGKLWKPLYLRHEAEEYKT